MIHLEQRHIFSTYYHTQNTENTLIMSRLDSAYKTTLGSQPAHQDYTQ